MTSQTRRASLSIGANLAEGACRGDVDFARFLQIAVASASEFWRITCSCRATLSEWRPPTSKDFLVELWRSNRC
jgi:four helix bundle protein